MPNIPFFHQARMVRHPRKNVQHYYLNVQSTISFVQYLGENVQHWFWISRRTVHHLIRTVRHLKIIVQQQLGLSGIFSDRFIILKFMFNMEKNLSDMKEK